MKNSYKFLLKNLNKEKQLKIKEENKFIQRFLFRKRLFKSSIYQQFKSKKYWNWSNILFNHNNYKLF